MDFKWSVLWESLKEPLRILLLGIVSWLVTVVVPQIPAQYIPVITLILKLVDEYLHQVGKDTKNDALLTGLTRF